MTETDSYTVRLSITLIIVIGVVVYANSFLGTFVYDDHGNIVYNQRIRQIWPPWSVLAGNARPIGSLSFAVNYGIHGLRLFGYHAVNLLIHLLAALTLYGICRRTFTRGQLAPRYGPAACGLALAVAVLWMVHPLQTQSVTYVVQRLEALMGLFYLLTLYCFIRAQDSPRRLGWYSGAVVCCALGMGTKEVMVTAPVMVLWYDRALVASSWREIFRRRGAFYAALAGTWGLLAVLMLGQSPSYYTNDIVVVKGISAPEYALSQPEVILHYLRLAFWPTGQCLDYAWPVAQTPGEIIPPLLAICGLLVATAWCVFRRPAWGFVGAWFFVILAPTSSIVPVRDLAYEHRMYLPLAAVVATVVVVGYKLLEKLLHGGATAGVGKRLLYTGLLLACVTALGFATHRRNRVYASDIALWSDVVQKAPHNWRGYLNLGSALLRQDEYEKAIHYLHRALELRPGYARASHRLAVAYHELGRLDEALHYCQEALRVNPKDSRFHVTLAKVLGGLKRFEESIRHYREAIRIAPSCVAAHFNLAEALTATDPDSAMEHYRIGLGFFPNDPRALNKLGLLCEHRGMLPEATEHFRKAALSGPGQPEPHFNLARLLSREGHRDEAIRHLHEALRLDPGYAASAQADPDLQSILELLPPEARVSSS
jgi:tetratricopeptide (TPR) repeat protein